MRRIEFSRELSESNLSISISGDYIKSTVLRSEGQRFIELQKSTVNFSWHGRCLNPHPHHVALIAVMAFWPVLAKNRDEAFEIHFNWPISSEEIQQALRKVIQCVRVTSRADGVDAYVPEQDVLSYGGGFDSLAASRLFPAARLVHETPLAVLDNRVTDSVIDVTHRIDRAIDFVYTDQRYLYDVFGLPVWVAVYASSLLFRPRTIYAGSVLESTYMQDGLGYRGFTDSAWYSLFESLGVSIRPTSFLSELCNARIVKQSGLMDAACYCQRIPFQDCGTCIKCLRRRLLRAILGEQFGEFKPTIDCIAELRKRPMKWGQAYSYARQKLGWLPGWMTAEFGDCQEKMSSDYSFQEGFYPQAFDDHGYNQEERSRVERLLDLFDIRAMTTEQTMALHAFRAFGQEQEIIQK